MNNPRVRERSTDILILGGGTGGVAAALSCARASVACIVVESTDWVGGQLTAQGVPPDENQWIETFGGTALYQRLRERVRAATMAAGAKARGVEPFGAFNPGGGWVSRCSAEPHVWHAELVAMLREAGGERFVRVLLNHEVIAATVVRDHVSNVRCRDSRSGEDVLITAQFVLDATETGDLWALGGVEHAIGAEHRDTYGEMQGRTDFAATQRIDPLDQQACSWCFALEHRAGEDHTISKPLKYDWWRAYSPGVSQSEAERHSPPPGVLPPGGGVGMSPPWTGPLFSWTVPSHSKERRRTFRMVPWPDEPARDEWEMWRYRRIVDASIWSGRPDVTVINMVQMDYWQKPLLGVSAAEQAAALTGAREQSLALLYWMQTEAPRHDGRGVGYPGLKLRGDELGTADGFAKAVYIREPRRLIARTMITEVHVGTDQRKADGHASRDASWSATPYGTAHRFDDSVGIGHYAIDLHPSCAGCNNVYVPCAPFRIPMGSLIPVRVRNALAAGKAMGVTHITNGAYRMHHVEWNVGESAGVLAAYCVKHGVEPAQVHSNADRVRDVQRVLGEQGVRMTWPWEV